MRVCLVMVSGRGGVPQPAVEELVGALENVVMTTSCVCALAVSHNNAPGEEHPRGGAGYVASALHCRAVLFQAAAAPPEV